MLGGGGEPGMGGFQESTVKKGEAVVQAHVFSTDNGF